MSSITIKGELVTGVEVDGQVHRSFTLRLPTLGDNVAAVDEVGGHNAVALNAAIIARQITQLGSLKPAQINYQLLCSMHPTDYNILDAKAAELEKKRMAAATVAQAPQLPQSPQASSAEPTDPSAEAQAAPKHALSEPSHPSARTGS